MVGISVRASRSSSYTAPAVTVVSKPCSSVVAPTTTSPLGRGTTYTEEPRTTARTARCGTEAGWLGAADTGGDGARRRSSCPFTGRTGGTARVGSPASDADQQPAASTT